MKGSGWNISKILRVCQEQSPKSLSGFFRRKLCECNQLKSGVSCWSDGFDSRGVHFHSSRSVKFRGPRFSRVARRNLESAVDLFPKRASTGKVPAYGIGAVGSVLRGIVRPPRLPFHPNAKIVGTNLLSIGMTTVNSDQIDHPAGVELGQKGRTLGHQGEDPQQNKRSNHLGNGGKCPQKLDLHASPVPKRNHSDLEEEVTHE